MEPDKTEKAVRFGCGFTFGLILGIFSAIRFIQDTWGGFATIGFVSAVVCGWLAMKYGDDFWYALKRWWWWV